jgi:hypothetical protein
MLDALIGHNRVRITCCGRSLHLRFNAANIAAQLSVYESGLFLYDDKRLKIMQLKLDRFYRNMTTSR